MADGGQTTGTVLGLQNVMVGVTAQGGSHAFAQFVFQCTDLFPNGVRIELRSEGRQNFARPKEDLIVVVGRSRDVLCVIIIMVRFGQ